VSLSRYAALLLLPVLAPAQPTISVSVNLVVLHVTVRDKKGDFVSGLQRDNFRVFENNKPQNIQFFTHEDVPVAVGLLIDDSGSMIPKRQDVTLAAVAFAKTSNPQDQMFVVNFNEHAYLGLPDTQLFSASPKELVRALNAIPPSGKTGLYNAIDLGLTHLKQAKLDKKVLIVISDGGDNASPQTLPQVLQAAERSNVIIYTVGLFDEYDEDRNPGVLKKLARETGGECFLPDKTSKIVPICERIAEDIRHQYTLGYAPSDTALDNEYRTIRVMATGPNGHKYSVRTRAGYLASAQGVAAR